MKGQLWSTKHAKSSVIRQALNISYYSIFVCPAG